MNSKNFKLKINFILIIASIIVCSKVFAQKTPAVNATLLSDSLVFVSSVASTGQTSMTYNPVLHKYYSVRLGRSDYPLETWNLTGGLSIYQDSCGIDTRGIWWNPNTNQVERNCFSNIGWATMNLNGSGNATHNFTQLFTGQNQPTVQSVGAYDYKTNTVIFNSSGIIHVYNRNTGAFVNSFALTGTSLANINTESVIYTGETGFEIGILNYVTKRVLLFNRANGVFSGVSQLPANALTHNQFRFCYANDRVWLFNATLHKWNSYNIWNQPLPIHLLSFNANLKSSNEVLCQWTTATETNNDYFTIERSADRKNFETIGKENGAGNSSSVLNYSFTDATPLSLGEGSGVRYYRLKQTDFNGTVSYSKIVTIQLVANEKFSIYPNPASGAVNIQYTAEIKGSIIYQLIDLRGKIVGEKSVDADAGLNNTVFDLDKIAKGIYMINVITGHDNKMVRLVVQ